MILFKTLRKEIDLVYNFDRIATVLDESENKATVLERKVCPIAYKVSYTTLSSLKVICCKASY